MHILTINLFDEAGYEATEVGLALGCLTIKKMLYRLCQPEISLIKSRLRKWGEGRRVYNKTLVR